VLITSIMNIIPAKVERFSTARIHHRQCPVSHQIYSVEEIKRPQEIF